MLAEDLTEIALEQDVTREEKTLFGVRYVIDGVLRTPLGRELSIRTIWFIDNHGQIPHFVTAYPR